MPSSVLPQSSSSVPIKKKKTKSIFLAKAAKKTLLELLSYVFLVALLIVWLHYLVAAKGYEVTCLKDEVKELQNKYETLNLKKEELADLKRIEEIATKELGMCYPNEEQVEVVKRQ